MSEKHANPYVLRLPVNLNGLGNAHDDAKETIRGRNDHDKAHGVRPVKAPQKESV